MMTLFFRFDKTHSDDELLFLECFCNIADGIEVRFLTLQYAPPPIIHDKVKIRYLTSQYVLLSSHVKSLDLYSYLCF